ncbi:MAG TPA: DUF2155 domain-containing protein [Verrucomicrobiae bacterium]|nr:DUF2155 domain-containing protein [Verrucomicrobiae bacterium]
MNRSGVTVAIGFALLLPALPAAADPYDTVILETLDKISARVSRVEVPVGTTITFGSLKITPRHCDKRPPEETPESSVFIEIVEEFPDEQPKLEFSGWMFASSPALSALDHPVYDVWVVDCKNSSTSAPVTTP